MRRSAGNATGLITCLICVLLHCSARAEPFIRVIDTPPPGFEALAAAQVTQADVYFGGRLLGAHFVEYDVDSVALSDPLAVAEQIPNLKDPRRIAHLLSGRLPNNASALCHARKRTDCGILQPQVVAVIFDESRFRLDIFVAEGELLVHELAREKYLPPSSAQYSMLSDVRSHVAGSGGNQRYNITSDSYLAHGETRLFARYGVADNGVSLSSLAWQHDGQDVAYELGSFRTRGRSATFSNDVDVFGFRMGSSTKRRLDLDTSRATPVHVFLAERSRIDVFRGDELINSRFYDAGQPRNRHHLFPRWRLWYSAEHRGLERARIQRGALFCA